MSPGDGRSRPPVESGFKETPATKSASSVVDPYRYAGVPTPSGTCRRRYPSLRSAEEAARTADLALRCAWLRVHAWEVECFDPSGCLTAQLLDLADLLEVAHREGWWSQ